jgi:hypothetical protein
MVSGAEPTRSRFQNPGQTVKRVVIALAMMVLPTSALAATFHFTPCGSHQNCFTIGIVGELQAGDGDTFAMQLALRKIDVAVVSLDSPGGNLVAGINIGRIIRTKGYETFVANGRQCASACGLIWLAGVRRLGERNARIGFHAAFITNRYGYAVEKGMGNALVGAYLNELGLSYEAIAYLTQASPYQMTWLKVRDARALGIDVEIINLAASPKTSPQGPVARALVRIGGFVAFPPAKDSNNGTTSKSAVTSPHVTTLRVSPVPPEPPPSSEPPSNGDAGCPGDSQHPGDDDSFTGRFTALRHCSAD